MIYADNAATTRLDPAALEAMLPYLKEEYANPSQPYSFAREAKKAIAGARETIAGIIGAEPEEIFFTSGGTESDNWAVKGTNIAGRKHIVTGAMEHHALTDYIMLPDQEMTVLPEAACGIFGLDREKGDFLHGLRAEIRHAMERLPYPIVSALYADIGETDRETVGRLIRYVRLTSDNADSRDRRELVSSLCAAFAADGGLPARIRTCLHGAPLREGFLRMLKKNGLDGGDIGPEKLETLCGGHPEWKWIWQEESIIHSIQGL